MNNYYETVICPHSTRPSRFVDENAVDVDIEIIVGKGLWLAPDRVTDSVILCWTDDGWTHSWANELGQWVGGSLITLIEEGSLKVDELAVAAEDAANRRYPNGITE